MTCGPMYKRQNPFRLNFFSLSIYVITLIVMSGILFSANPNPSYADIKFGWVAPDPNIEQGLIDEGKADIVIIPHLPPSYIQPMNDMKACSPVRQQPGPECVAFSVTALMEYLYHISNPSKAPAEFSPIDLFCACKEEEIERDVLFQGCNLGDINCGTSIHLAVKHVLRGHGVYPENCSPCCQNRGIMCTLNDCEEGCRSRITSRGYTFIDSDPAYQHKIAAMKSCLFQDMVFVAGIPVFTNWMGQTADVTEYPNYPPSPQDIAGGHALCFVGYADNPSWPGGGYFWFKNSWSAFWGNNGYGRVSYEFMRLHAREIAVVDGSEVIWSEWIEGDQCLEPLCPDNHIPEIVGLRFTKLDIGIDKEIGFTVSAIDADDHDITYSIKGQNPATDAELNPDTGEFSWTPQDSGTYEITIEATDSCQGSTAETITIEVPQCPPCDSCCNCDPCDSCCKCDPCDSCCKCPRCDSCCKSTTLSPGGLILDGGFLGGFIGGIIDRNIYGPGGGYMGGSIYGPGGGNIGGSIFDLNSGLISNLYNPRGGLTGSLYNPGGGLIGGLYGPGITSGTYGGYLGGNNQINTLLMF